MESLWDENLNQLFYMFSLCLLSLLTSSEAHYGLWNFSLLVFYFHSLTEFFTRPEDLQVVQPSFKSTEYALVCISGISIHNKWSEAANGMCCTLSKLIIVQENVKMPFSKIFSKYKVRVKKRIWGFFFFLSSHFLMLVVCVGAETLSPLPGNPSQPPVHTHTHTVEKWLAHTWSLQV